MIGITERYKQSDRDRDISKKKGLDLNTLHIENMWIFSVEGNIGAGKSTLLESMKNLKFDRPHKIIQEPVNEWTSETETSTSILELYYSDKARYAFTFQMFALQTRFEHIYNVMKENPDTILICERCPLTDFEIFAKMLFDSKQMSECEIMIYKRWYEFMDMLIGPKIKGILYLEMPISTCASRIIKRNRKGEGNITMDYLQSLHQQHETWLSRPELPYTVHEIKWSEEDGYDNESIIGYINSMVDGKSCDNKI